MKRISLVIVSMLVILAMFGCANQTKPQTLPPGAFNSADAKLFDSLMVAQASLESVKKDAANLPASAKPLLNKAIASYNMAEAAYQGYRAAVAAGKAGDQTGVTVAIVQATADISALVQSLVGGGK